MIHRTRSTAFTQCEVMRTYSVRLSARLRGSRRFWASEDCVRLTLVRFSLVECAPVLLEFESGTTCRRPSTAKLVIQQVQRIAEDVFIWAQRSVNRL